MSITAESTSRRPATECILGWKIISSPFEDLWPALVRILHNREKGRLLVCANPHSLCLAEKYAEFHHAFQDADFVLPDGIGIVLASRLAGGGIRKRITGMDLFLSLNRELARIGGRIFLLGTTNKNLAAICEKLSREFPGLQIAGYYAPPFAESFTDEEENHMVKQINAAAPDILWIGLGSPKQEIWARRNLRRLDTCLIAPVGAVFDFYTGRIMRPAPLFQRTGLEWLIRLMGHPPRLYERTLISAPWFLARVIGDRPWRRKCGRRENAE